MCFYELGVFIIKKVFVYFRYNYQITATLLSFNSLIHWYYIRNIIIKWIIAVMINPFQASGDKSNMAAPKTEEGMTLSIVIYSTVSH